MGKLLLAHLERVPCVEESEQTRPEDLSFTVKNTFIHFDVSANRPRQASLPRCRTEPTSQEKNALMPAPSAHVEENSSIPATDANASGNDSDALTELKASLSQKLASPSTDLSTSGGSCTWIVDGRRLKGRDTRIASVLRPPVGGGPDCADLVVSIFPVPATTKRGGACFKASNGVGYIQVKCNNPIDMDLSVCITVGSNATRCQRHNFATNPLMHFHGDWDFKVYIDSNVDRPTVAVSLLLVPTNEAVDPAYQDAGSVTNAISDPAIAAFSLSTMKATSEHPFQPSVPRESEKVKDALNETVAEQTSTIAPSSSTPEETPQSTPRTPPPACSMHSAWQGFAPQTPTPSPCFSYGGSFLFCFTLRRAEGIELGLDVTVDESNQELVVRKVVAGGAAEAWNRQCFAGPFSSKAVVPTDRIVGINGRSDCVGMLEECRQNQLLKLFVVRGDLLHADIPLGWCSAPCSQPIQLVPYPVPIFLPVPCAKHAIVECQGGNLAAAPEQPQGNAATLAEVTAIPCGATPDFFLPGGGFVIDGQD